MVLSLPKQPIEATIPDPVLNHKWKPNIKIVDRARKIPYTHYANRQSWVERYDVLIDKPQGSKRIFYVGDSTVQGVVEQDKKMTEIVEKELNKILNKKDERIEVINTGTTSYSPLLYYLLIKNELVRYSPDIVVINIDMTDVRDDYVYKKLSILDRNNLPLAVKPSDVKGKETYRLTPQGIVKIPSHTLWLWQIQEFARETSALYYHTENLIYSVPKPRFLKAMFPQPTNLYILADTSADWLSLSWTEETRQNVDYSMFVLGQTILFLKQHNIKVSITGVPHYPQYTGIWSARPHEILAKVAKDYDIPYLNSHEALKNKIKNSKQSQYYWENDPTHFNEEGDSIWAKAHVSFLLDPKNKLLDLAE